MAGSKIRRKTKISFNGEMVDAELMNIAHSEEYWNEYTLDDGTILRYKSVAVEIWRIVGQQDAEGKPIIMVKASHLASVGSAS